MTPETLVAELRLHYPNTEIVLGDKPGRVVVKMAPKPYPLTVFIALSKSGERYDLSTEEIAQRPRDTGGGLLAVKTICERIEWRVTAQTTQDPRRIYQNAEIKPRIRAWAHLPDMPESLRDRARALLAADRKALAKLQADARGHEENIADLERALGVAK